MPAMPSSGECHAVHDWFGSLLGALLLTGLVLSYLPQILRIILAKNSLGLSPWFLLLGATSSASGFFNVLTLQWGVARCCPSLGVGLCLESLIGLMQVGLQWALGLIIFALYLYYYPEDHRYEGAVSLDEEEEAGNSAFTLDESVSEGEGDGDGCGSGSGSGSGVDSGVEQTPTQSTIARFTDEELRVEEEEVSSSAFARLVPSFWPMWKAPARPTPGPSPLARSTPTTFNGRQGADGSLQPIGASLGAASRPTPASTTSVPTEAATAAAPATASGQGKRVTIAVPPPTPVLGQSSMFGLWRQEIRKKWRTKAYEWGLATALAWVSVIHLLFVALVTCILLFALPSSAFPVPQDPQFPAPVPPPVLVRYQNGLSPTGLIQGWATLLGVTGTALATAQYLPQLYYTASRRLVGSLSIPMMCIQTPGTAVFVYSLIIRPGVNWTSILSYCFTGVLQGTLLVMCIFFKFRQANLGLDDFGNPLVETSVAESIPPVVGAADGREEEHVPAAREEE